MVIVMSKTGIKWGYNKKSFYGHALIIETSELEYLKDN